MIYRLTHTKGLILAARLLGRFCLAQSVLAHRHWNGTPCWRVHDIGVDTLDMQEAPRYPAIAAGGLVMHDGRVHQGQSPVVHVILHCRHNDGHLDEQCRITSPNHRIRSLHHCSVFPHPRALTMAHQPATVWRHSTTSTTCRRKDGPPKHHNDYAA